MLAIRKSSLFLLEYKKHYATPLSFRKSNFGRLPRKIYQKKITIFDIENNRIVNLDVTESAIHFVLKGYKGGDAMVNAEELFTPDLVFLDWELDGPSALFEKLNGVLLPKGYVNEGWLDGITKREKAYPTGLCAPSLDFAIPHTDPEFIEHEYIAIIKPKSPVPFDCMGGIEGTANAQIMFNLGVSGDGSQVEVLKRLLGVFMNPDTANEVLRQESPEALVAKMCEVF